MLRIRERPVIHVRCLRFKMRKATDDDQYQNPSMRYIVDRDADHGSPAPLVVAIVHAKYADALLALMNRGDDNGLLALRPAKRRKYAVPLCQERDPTNNAWWACSRPRGHQGGCRFDRKAPKR